jgi:3-phosphoshikimate 1-carboxyvinyltransferase
MTQKTIQIPASKSLSNRWLILQYLWPELVLNNLSTAQDTKVLQEALLQINEAKNPININIGHAGTAMRFLTALLSTIPEKTFILDGSARMRQRPIKILVDALKQLGADISYLNQEGFPPLKISGKKLYQTDVKMPQNVSSQYISALLLIATSLPNGLQIGLEGQAVSKPYVNMTLSILQKIGIDYRQTPHSIQILPAKKINPIEENIEGDWSSASYFYGAAAVLQKPVSISPFHPNSWQGDQKIMGYFEKLGVITKFDNGYIHLKPQNDFTLPDYLEFDLIETPDLAQTLATTCLALGMVCKLTGLQTLRIKETDRLAALKTEMEKLGASVQITEQSLEITKPIVTNTKVSIDTYDDHRMAMSFAILQLKYPDIQINEPDVVVKSFPDFWTQFKYLT